MPTYIFICDIENGGCGRDFEVQTPMSEINKLIPPCHFCHNKKSTRRDWQKQDVYTFDSTPKTVGSLADRNTSKLSNDEKTVINQKNTEYLETKKNAELPKGMTRATVDTRRSPDKDPRKKGK